MRVEFSGLEIDVKPKKSAQIKKRLEFEMIFSGQLNLVKRII